MLKTKGIHLAPVALAILAAPALGAGDNTSSPPAPTAGAVHVELQIKPGLWEFADTPKVSGDTIFSDAMVANVPPAQRAQYLTEMRRQMAEPHKARECMTQAKFEQRLSLDPGGCTRVMASNTASELDLQTTCQRESHGMKQSTEQKIEASSPTTVTSSLHAVTTRGAETMIIDTTEIGRWLGADCGSLKNDVIQQLP